MSSILNILRSNLLLTVALVSSVLLLCFGLFLIYTAPATVPAKIPSSEEVAFDIPSLPEVDRGPPAELTRIQAALDEMAAGIMPTGRLSPQELADAQARAEIGSETWCDILMLKPDADWTETEAEQFAQHCI